MNPTRAKAQTEYRQPMRRARAQKVQWVRAPTSSIQFLPIDFQCGARIRRITDVREAARTKSNRPGLSDIIQCHGRGSTEVIIIIFIFSLEDRGSEKNVHLSYITKRANKVWWSENDHSEGTPILRALRGCFGTNQVLFARGRCIF